ncbi:MAG: hypothetical protein NDI73_12330 [Desulfuromonadales bacterium]|nr:hypothetical protein [Desulfuromonadales bacterium]
MKNLLRGLGWMVVWGASAAYAAQGSEGETLGWLGSMFIGFFAVVIATQLVPAAIMFIGMLKGIFATTEDPDATAHGK